MLIADLPASIQIYGNTYRICWFGSRLSPSGCCFLALFIYLWISWFCLVNSNNIQLCKHTTFSLPTHPLMVVRDDQALAQHFTDTLFLLCHSCFFSLLLCHCCFFFLVTLSLLLCSFVTVTLLVCYIFSDYFFLFLDHSWFAVFPFPVHQLTFLYFTFFCISRLPCISRQLWKWGFKVGKFF